MLEGATDQISSSDAPQDGHLHFQDGGGAKDFDLARFEQNDRSNSGTVGFGNASLELSSRQSH